MVPKDCGKTKSDTVDLNSGDTKQNILAELERAMEAQPTVASVLKYMRRQSFNSRKGARQGAKRIGVVFVDEGDDLMKTKHEAKKARELSNIELYVVAVGRKFNKRKLRNIASQPYEDHLFIVPTYEHLPPMLSLVRESICPSTDS